MLQTGEVWGEVGVGAGKEAANDPLNSVDMRLSGEMVPWDRLPALRWAADADGNLTLMDVRLALCSPSGDCEVSAIVLTHIHHITYTYTT